MQSHEDELVPTNLIMLETRFACIEGWFIRARWENKMNFIAALISILKESGVSRLLSEINLAISKGVAYSENSKTDSFDNATQDDDRELDQATLQYVMKEDLVWFGSLSAEDQLTILTGLIRNGGVPSARKALAALQKKINQPVKIKQLVNDILSESPLLLETQQRFIRKYEEQKESRLDEKDKKSPQQKVKKADRTDASWKIVNSSAVQAAMRSWILEMSKMQGELQSWDPHDKFKASSTSNNIDILQTLPVWSTKYFARMLPPLAQKEMKKVNNYWNVIMDDISDDRQTRSLISKSVTKSVLKGSKLSKIIQATEEKSKAKKTSDHDKEKAEEPVPNIVKPRSRTIVQLLDQSQFQYGHSNITQYCLINVMNQNFNSTRVIACSPKTGILAVSTLKQSIEFHSLITGAPLTTTLTGHLGAITCLCFHPDGDKIFSGSSDLTVRFWDVWTQNTKKIYTGHEQTITSISVNHDFIASAGSDQRILVHQIYSGLQIIRINEKQSFTSLYIETMPKFKIFSANDEGEIIVFNNNAKGRKSVKGHAESILTMYVTKHIVLTGSSDGYIKAWNKHRIEKCLLSLNNKSPVRSVILSLHQVISGCESGHVKLWCICKGTLLHSFPATTELRPVLQILTTQGEDTPGNLVIATDCTLQIFDFYQGDEEYRHVYHTICCNNPNKINDFYFPLCRWASKKAMTEAMMKPDIFQNGHTIQESFYHKRIQTTIIRGCTDRKLRSKQSCNWHKALFLTALQEMQHVVPINPLTPFPRSNYITD